MCAIPTLLANFDGNLLAQTRDSVVTLTSSGPVRYVDGAAPGSLAYVAEEGTTNLVPNPWHAVDATGWTGTTRDTSYAVQGPASGLITASGAGATATIPITAAASAHTVQAIVRNNAASARTFQLRYNSTDAGDAVVVAAGAEQTITASVTGTGGSAALGVQVTDSEAAETYNVGYLGAEQKPYATSPCPAIAANGDIIAGYTWAGTAHASASTRAGGLAYTPAGGRLRADRGEIVVRFHIMANGTQGRGVIVGHNHNGSNRIYLTRESTDVLGASFGDNHPAITGGAMLSRDVPVTASVAWDGGTGRLYQDDVLVGEAAYTGLSDIGSNLVVGNYSTPASTNYANSAIDGVAVFDRPLTSAERQRIMNASTWEWDTLIPRFGGIHVSVPIEPITVAVSVPVDVTGG